MTCAAELFTSLSSIWSGDTGTGGLSDSTSAAYVPVFMRIGDSNNRGLNKPRVEIEIVEDETDRFGKDSVEVLVRFHVYTDLLARFGSGSRNQDTVLNRMRVKFHRIAVAGQTLWTFSEMAFSGMVQAVANVANNELHAVVNARLTAREV